MTIIIRNEQPQDILQIDAIHHSAFLYDQYSNHNEHLIVRELRNCDQLTVSIVAVDEDTQQIIAHVAVSPVKVLQEFNVEEGGWYGLGPLAVIPSRQGQGIGSLLMQAALQQLKQVHANGCVLLGEPEYYQRFGFLANADLVLPGVPAHYFQALCFKGKVPKGVVQYHQAFEVTG